ncbi:MAG: hypothetical protein COV30_01370 [Candidatus Yanofskybacteria bacterium CG10_big_fil_rev_8_21_14_0_10_37_15]|uniref:Glycosyltransferase family 1 protein n=1 Tax=Candidatus Yanofskybacteria bacterium CG10_big_fil_rev_8_21_14_0_10_37_15 TaxID=1975097 RepID=A0A2H0R721_9BACT|nr:MAG: hypothetical protein COV30_01370 [Candidatus Yanofskybacteria bacterium CG10_big_fil_rev_8_21_14_0_10_37_15]
MKILILQDKFPPENLGGAGVVAFNLANIFRDEGNSVFVITTVQDKKEEGVSEHEGLKIFKIYSKYHERWRAYLSLYNPQTIGKIKKILREVKPDVVHAHNVHYYLSYQSLKLAKKEGAKVFLTTHDMMLFHYGKLVESVNFKDLSCENKNYRISPWRQIKKFKKRYNPFRNIIIQHYLEYVDRIFAVSDTHKEALNQNGINNVKVIHNGIDTNKWRVDESATHKFKEKYSLRGKKVILFSGRLSFYKGGYQAILAMEKIIKEIPEAMLLIIGEKNSFAEEMFKKSKNLGVEKSLIFTGWIQGKELKAAYSASDIVFFLSLGIETFGLINIEAMASKKPVVATCLGGAPEIVRDGVTGYIVDPLNVELLANRVIKILSDAELAKRMGQAGYERVKDHFSLQKQVDEYLKEFRGV